MQIAVDTVWYYRETPNVIIIYMHVAEHMAHIIWKTFYDQSAQRYD